MRQKDEFIRIQKHSKVIYKILIHSFFRFQLVGDYNNNKKQTLKFILSRRHHMTSLFLPHYKYSLYLFSVIPHRKKEKKKWRKLLKALFFFFFLF